MRDAVQKIRRPIERIDDPAVTRVAAATFTRLFHQKTVTRPRLGEFAAHQFLGLEIGIGDEIPGPLHRDLELLDLAEIALETARRLERSSGHYIDRRRTNGH